MRTGFYSKETKISSLKDENGKLYNFLYRESQDTPAHFYGRVMGWDSNQEIVEGYADSLEKLKTVLNEKIQQRESEYEKLC